MIFYDHQVAHFKAFTYPPAAFDKNRLLMLSIFITRTG